jgi:hypothetical protein
MPYREKTAWLSLVAMAVTFGPYFTFVAASPPAGPLPDLRQLGLYAVVAITQMFILGIGHLLLRRSSPEDASMPLDERDRAIVSRSMSTAYYVLIAGMILVGCVLPFVAGGWSIVNAALFTIVITEVTRYGIVVLSYRRQS